MPPSWQRLACFIVVAVFPALIAPAAEPVSFRNDIAPLLLEHCTSCHGPKKAEGGYRLDSFAQLSKAGDTGIAPLLVEEEHPSELIRRLTTDDEVERMPAERAPLPAKTIELFKRWQSEGSKFDGNDPQSPIFEIVPDPIYPPSPQVYTAPVPVTAVTFSPDGLHVIASGYHELTVWDAVSGQLVRRIQNLPERIHALDWSADRKSLAVSGGSPGRLGEVRIIEWESGKIVNCFGRATDVIQAVRFQPDGQRIATGNSDGTVRWFDTSDWHLIRSLASHADSVTDVRWSSDGRHLASASRDKTAKVFDVESGELLATYSAHAEVVTGICFNEGDKEMTSIGGDRKVHRWQIEGSKTLAKIDLPAAPIRLLTGNSHAWLTLADNSLREFDLKTSKLSRQLDGHTGWVTAVCSDFESRRLASGALNGEIRMWQMGDKPSSQTWIAAPGFSKPLTN